jgi:hypothetical protein
LHEDGLKYAMLFFKGLALGDEKGGTQTEPAIRSLKHSLHDQGSIVFSGCGGVLPGVCIRDEV